MTPITRLTGAAAIAAAEATGFALCKLASPDSPAQDNLTPAEARQADPDLIYVRVSLETSTSEKVLARELYQSAEGKYYVVHPEPKWVKVRPPERRWMLEQNKSGDWHAYSAQGPEYFDSRGRAQWRILATALQCSAI
jgi:hypothetical protein